jgi:hypothetical protein
MGWIGIFKKKIPEKGYHNEKLKSYQNQLKKLKKLSYVSDDEFSSFLKKIYISEPPSDISILNIVYYSEIDIYHLLGTNNFKLNKQQVAMLFEVAFSNDYLLIENRLDFDYKQVLRRIKIEKIMRKK